MTSKLDKISQEKQKAQEQIEQMISNHVSVVELSAELLGQISKNIESNKDYQIPTDIMDELVHRCMIRQIDDWPQNVEEAALYAYVNKMRELSGFEGTISKPTSKYRPRFNFKDRFKKIAEKKIEIKEEIKKEKKRDQECANKIENMLKGDEDYSRRLKYDHSVNGVIPEIAGLKIVLKETKKINLNTRQQLLLTEIIKYSKKGYLYFVSNEELSRRLDTCDRNVRKIIKKLKDLGIIERTLKKGRFFKRIIKIKIEEGDEKAQYFAKRTLKISGEYLKLIKQIQKANLKIRRNNRKKVPDNINKGIYNNIIYKYQGVDSLIYRKDISNIFDKLCVPENVQKLLALRLPKIFYVANKKFRTKNIFSQRPEYLTNLIKRLKYCSHGYIPEFVEKIFSKFDSCPSSYTFFSLREDEYHNYYLNCKITDSQIHELSEKYKYQYIKEYTEPKEKEKEKVALKRKRKSIAGRPEQAKSYDIEKYLNDCDQYSKNWYATNVLGDYGQNPQKPLQNAPECDFRGKVVKLYSEGEKGAKNALKIDLAENDNTSEEKQSWEIIKTPNKKTEINVAITQPPMLECTKEINSRGESHTKVLKYKFDNIDSEIFYLESEKDRLLEMSRGYGLPGGGGVPVPHEAKNAGQPNSCIDVSTKINSLEERLHSLYRVRKRLEETIAGMGDGTLKDCLRMFCIRSENMPCIAEKININARRVEYIIQKFFKGFEKGFENGF